jgi:hypothetical protein
VYPGTVAAVRRMLPLMCRISLAGAPPRVTLRASSGARLAASKGAKLVMTGTPPELLLFLSGGDAVRVEFSGGPETIAAVRAARRRL